jgi:outer membrane protein assembly factor BamA
VGREHETLSFGFGLNFEVSDKLAFRLDYANVDLNEFGKSDTFSLSVVF